MPPIESDSDRAARGASAPLLDRVEGLERVMGDQRLYARMLARFRQDYQNGAEPMLRALEAGNRALAHRQAHTLKGAAGMIGAQRLHLLATAAEVALRTASGHEHAALQQLGIGLRAILDELNTELLPGMATPTLATATLTMATPLAGPALVAQLMTLLENGDGAAVDLAEQSGPGLQAIYGPVLYRRLLASVNDFNYAAALRLLRLAPTPNKLPSG